MNKTLHDQLLGLRLRELSIQGKLRLHVPAELEAILSDLCMPHQRDLLPALNFLFRSHAFASAAEHIDQIGDSGHMARLISELQGQFAPEICQRVKIVLMSLSGQTTTYAARYEHANSAIPFQASIRTPTSRTFRLSQNMVLIVLFFLVGGLSSTLVALLISNSQNIKPKLQQERPQKQTIDPLASSSQPRSRDPFPEDMPIDKTKASDLAVYAINDLYSALSSKDYQRARRLFDLQAADQFDPDFFNQFERVIVSDLEVINFIGSTINLKGIITFVYRDGRTQRETRSFSVNTALSPAKIIASEFVKVLKFR